MTSIAQLIKASEYVNTGRYPVQASVVFLNKLIISAKNKNTELKKYIFSFISKYANNLLAKFDSYSFFVNFNLSDNKYRV